MTKGLQGVMCVLRSVDCCFYFQNLVWGTVIKSRRVISHVHAQLLHMSLNFIIAVQLEPPEKHHNVPENRHHFKRCRTV